MEETELLTSDEGSYRNGRAGAEPGRENVGPFHPPHPHPTNQALLLPRYVELVNAACNFEPHESFFSLFSDPRSTRLTRIHLREDLVQDQDLEAIRKQVRPALPASGDGRGEAGSG